MGEWQSKHMDWMDKWAIDDGSMDGWMGGSHMDWMGAGGWCDRDGSYIYDIVYEPTLVGLPKYIYIYKIKFSNKKASDLTQQNPRRDSLHSLCRLVISEKKVVVHPLRQLIWVFRTASRGPALTDEEWTRKRWRKRGVRLDGGDTCICRHRSLDEWGWILNEPDMVIHRTEQQSSVA